MQLARVVGSAVASVKEPRMTGMKLLLVEEAAPDGSSDGGAYIAADLVGAGEGELVIVVRGSPAAAINRHRRRAGRRSHRGHRRVGPPGRHDDVRQVLSR